MLELRSIQKEYPAGEGKVIALKGIDLTFRQSEFVSILGPSGCGKTTLLNIIGGLDQYTDGDLLINGRSTKDFKDRDWDSYRNHSIGFVFQSYNLIPHQTVLQNVELALTLSGVSKAERRQRAAKVLEEVGLGDQLDKKPNQMSGGQMQRVAIARALVNDPDIILADEPTGALDTETSVQVMEILKKISAQRLIIMVTHNPDLAEQYSSRIIRILDGRIISDSAPLSPEESLVEAKRDEVRLAAAGTERKPSMSLWTSFNLSLKNLFTKKGRTTLTAFAGSIGIIGIALIAALSSGINTYIDQVQQDTLASYPITIQRESVDMSSMLSSLMGVRQEREEAEPHEEDRVYSSVVMYDMLNSMVNAEVETNNLAAFKTYLDEGGGGISDLATIHYGYDFSFDIYTEDTDGNVVKSDVMTLMEDAMTTMYGGDYSSYFSNMGSMYQGMDVWEELLPGEDGELIADQVKGQYDLLYGSWPKSYDEVILFVNSSNEISDLMLYALGYISSDAMSSSLEALMNGEAVEADQESWSFEELCKTSFKLILPAEYYQKDSASDGYVDMSKTDTGMDYLYNSSDVGTALKVVGIARPNQDAASSMVTGAIGYTSALTTFAIENTASMDIVTAQMADETVDIFNGLPFATGDEVEPSDEEKQSAITEHLRTLSTQEKADAYLELMSTPSDEYVENIVEQQMDGLTRDSIEEMIVEQYATEMGVDASTVSSYIAEMDDDTLFSLVEEAIDQQVREQYGRAAQQRLSAMSYQQLAGALDLLLDGDRTALRYSGMQPLETWQYNFLYENYMPPTVSDSSYEENLDTLGYVDLNDPATVNIYATSFADKDAIAEQIRAYNERVENEEDEITYTDYVALLMSSITKIISGISYLLIAFVSISLIVSSIMIGVITLISVQERTKEIGILRAIGASKRDVSSMFNAETAIIGFCAGALGIIVTYLLCIPINAILHRVTDIENLSAALPVSAAVILIVISVLLTLIAGIIPSRSAAKKDPVVALRTE